MHIDYETDAIIQNSLRRELKSDVTVITVAHRLQTIMDSDKVVSASPLFICANANVDVLSQMVLDAGRLVSKVNRPTDLPIMLKYAQVEFASPKELLQNKQSFLRALVEESTDKETLYSMVGHK